ncbi:Hpc2-related domain containing protein [Parasponia andersonii]|uniref:Hpc2-related domain containing protein n=1 Tax=Parasponia andersonii TaxID=3476 RepID=A0A2P5CGG9_PARAD|nr:Hpc2-related domain containing protein [Parasponia andersonii]
MEEEKRGGGDSSRASSSFVKSGDRQMFTVELRPGETTIVSWKKLMKDANKVNEPSSAPAPEPPVNAHPALESRIAPVQQDGDEVKDEPAPNRFSAVIEKIERLYMGKDSSDDEDRNDMPDDDQYDTEDSFIDDAELDEYFEVDNSAIKHDGFFVNRGKLERMWQPKKRRRKDLAKGNGENDDSRVQNKHAKLGKMATGKITSAPAKNLSSATQTGAVSGEHSDDMKFQNQLNASAFCYKKKSSDSKTILDPSNLKVSNGDTTMTLAEVKDIDKQKAGALLSKDPSSKFKDVAVSSDSSHPKYHDRSAYAQSKSQSGRPLSNVDELESTVRAREKNGICELSDVNMFEGKYTTPAAKTSHMHKKDGSSMRPKGSMLEKAIRELEKMVAESRPPAVESQEADNSSQAIKRRLPREIKMKLAKVARLAQASHGKVSKELLNRLMSILGHLIQLRTLKRNLKVMISVGLSAKQEKDDRFQQIKKEVVDMIKMRAPSMELKALEQQAGASDDFQEIPTEEKESSKRKFSIDAALEDKICDLYDLYVDGLDEDAGPQIRKLYAELAKLWPNGFMDNHGIKGAICRAKERRRGLYSRNKDQEKIKRKKMLAPRTEENVRVEASSISQAQYIRERLPTESGSHSSANKPVSASTVAVRIPSPLNVLSFDKVKQEKVKGSSSHSLDDVRVGDGAMPKKKVKRKPEVELDETRLRPEKLPSQLGEERQKSHKQATSLQHKPNLQSTVLPSLEQSS